MALFDLKSAFDTVWHDGLLFKMRRAGFPTYLVKIIRSYLTNRTFRVKIGRQFSSSRSIMAGVPQGGVLSPVLFNIFLHDLPIPNHCDVAQFADDISIWTSSRRAAVIRGRLQEACKTLTRYFKKWRLVLNPQKTECIFFTRRRSAKAFPRKPLKVQDCEIPWKDTTKYLGVYLDQKLTFHRHMDHVTELSGKCTRLLYPLLARSSRLHFRNKLLLYKTILRPTFLHTSPAWNSCAATHRNRLQVIQNRNLKMCLKLPWIFPTVRVHEMAKVEKVDQFLHRMNVNFAARCRMSDNPLIVRLLLQ